MNNTSPLSSRGILSHGILSFGAQILNSLIAYFAIIAIIKNLGAYQYGIFSYTMVITGITSILTDFGMNPILLRMLAQTPERSKQIISEATLARMVLFIPTIIITNLIVLTQQHEAGFLLLLNIMLLNILFSAKMPIVRGTFETVFRARARMSVPAMVALFDSVVLFLLTFFYTDLFHSPLSAMIAYTASNLIGFIVITLWCYAILRQDRIASWKINYHSMKSLLIESAPLALFLFLMAVHLQIDSIYLDWFFSKKEVGEYNAALRLITPFLFLPTIVGWALAPFISISHQQKDEYSIQRIERLYSIGMKTLLIIACCIAIVGWRLAEPFVNIAFSGGYSASVIPLIFYFISYPLVALNLFQIEINNACGYQKKNTFFSIIVAAIVIILGPFIIPRFSLLGASVTKLISIAFGFGYLFYSLHKIIHWKYSGTLFKAATMTCVAIVSSFIIPSNLWVAQGIAIVLCYCVGMLLLQYFSEYERKMWWTQLTYMLGKRESL